MLSLRGWPQTCDASASVSGAAETTGEHHCAWPAHFSQPFPTSKWASSYPCKVAEQCRCHEANCPRVKCFVCDLGVTKTRQGQGTQTWIGRSSSVSQGVLQAFTHSSSLPWWRASSLHSTQMHICTQESILPAGVTVSVLSNRSFLLNSLF